MKTFLSFIAIPVLFVVLIVEAHQQAELPAPVIPARFVTVYSEKQEGLEFILKRDTKTGSGNVCFLLVRVIGTNNSSMLALPQACD